MWGQARGRRVGGVVLCAVALVLAAGAQLPWRTPTPWSLTLFGGWPYQAQGSGGSGELGLAAARDLNRWFTFSPRVTWYRVQNANVFTASCIASPSLPCANHGPEAWSFETDLLINLRFGQRWVAPYVGAGAGLAAFTGVSAARRYDGLGDFLAGAAFPVAQRWALRPELRLGNDGLSSLTLGLSYSF
ncbi:MAG: hypothetical protein ACRD2E_07295 [Terriglobales bacterium]